MNSFRSALEKGQGAANSGPLMPVKKPSGANEEAGLGSVAVTREAKRLANHRDGDRHRLAEERAQLRVGRKTHDVELVNLSGGGAMVRTDVELDMWQKVTLVLGDCDGLECAVRWRRDDRVGLEFAHETQIGGDPEKRARMLLDVLKRSFPQASAPVIPTQTRNAPVVEKRSGNQRRAAVRHPLIWSGEILYSHDAARVRLRNISETGALVDCDRSYPPNAEVLLDLGGAGQHFATVTWSRGDQVGLRFTKPFDIAQLAKSRPEVATHQWTAPSYLNGKMADGDGWEAGALPELRDDLEGFLKR